MPVRKSPLVHFMFDSSICTGFIALEFKYHTPKNAYAIHKVVPVDMEYILVS